MIKIERNTKIYVACESNIATGGPELLHQLVFHLKEYGCDAVIYYYDKKDGKKIHDNYLKYTKEFVSKIEDSCENIIVVPENSTKLLYKFKNVKKVIWWLSVDNYYKTFGKKDLLLSYFGINRVFLFKEDKNKYFHLAQSEYARQFLLKKGVDKIEMLSDYLNESFIDRENSDVSKNRVRSNILLYNPKKGIEFTQKILELLGDSIEALPIINLSPDEIGELMLRAKLYIDFGNHPGKDRLPREAACSGCCIITSTDGSANFFQDVGISDDYKFESVEENLSHIVDKIEDIMNNYEIRVNDFSFYCDTIKRQKDQFLSEMKKVFWVE